MGIGDNSILIALNCPNCQAQFSIKNNELIGICPYCGSSIVVDSKNLALSIDSKEQTIRKTIEEQEETKREEIKNKGTLIREKTNSFLKKLAIIAYIVFMLLAFFFYAMEEKKTNDRHIKYNEIQITFSSKEAKGQNYLEISAALQNLGFYNIEYVEDEDLFLGVVAKENTVKSITINGSKSFDKDDWISTDSYVVITYHAYKNKEKD